MPAMTDMTDNATKALESVIQGDRNQEAIDLLKRFATVWGELAGERNFTVQQVLEWVRKYNELEKLKDLPSCFKSGHALGKLIRSQQECLGIREVGSYGNRVVYQVAKEEGDKT